MQALETPEPRRRGNLPPIRSLPPRLSDGAARARESNWAERVPELRARGSQSPNRDEQHHVPPAGDPRATSKPEGGKEKQSRAQRPALPNPQNVDAARARPRRRARVAAARPPREERTMASTATAAEGRKTKRRLRHDAESPRDEQQPSRAVGSRILPKLNAWLRGRDTVDQSVGAQSCESQAAIAKWLGAEEEEKDRDAD